MTLKWLVWHIFFFFEKQKMSSMPAINESYVHVFDLSHTGTTGFWEVIGILVVLMQRGIYFQISSAVTAFRVTLWLDDRLSGVLSQTAVCEKGARGKQRGVLDSWLLSSQSSLFVFPLRIVWSTLPTSKKCCCDNNVHILGLHFLWFSCGLLWMVITIHRI